MKPHDVEPHATNAAILTTATAMMLSAMISWDETNNAMSHEERHRVEAAAAGIAEAAARLSAYLSRRASGGTHSQAVARQNQAASRVRAALGYTYKHAPINF
jgi:hypothetical protein